MRELQDEGAPSDAGVSPMPEFHQMAELLVFFFLLSLLLLFLIGYASETDTTFLLHIMEHAN